MSRALELTLGSLFKNTIKVYIETFPRAFAAYRSGPVDFDSALKSYSDTITSNCDAIYRMAARDINGYLQTYSIHANKSADEYKIIYFLGRAIEKHLKGAGYIELAQAHMFSMVGLLDFRLQTLDIFKPKLTKAMTKLIRLNVFDAEMGKTGCYMTYKCVATGNKDKGQISEA